FSKVGALRRVVMVLVAVVGVTIITPTYGQDKLPTPKRFRAKSIEHLNEMTDRWLEGEVTFWNGETIFCQLSYSPLVPEGMVKIMEDNLIRALTVHDVESFSFYNHDTYTNHTYYALPLINDRLMFAELLYEDCYYAILGSRSLLAEITNYLPGPSAGTVSRSFEYVNMSYADAYRGNAATTTKFIMDYRWFLIDVKQGQAYDFSLDALDDQRKKLRKFIRANNLEFETLNDYIKVVQQYENLTGRFCE
ncbi:MAG: hypothetical protein AAF632_21675, partial [Bacteroidota bacterium]